MKHVVLFGKIFYVTHPSFGEDFLDNVSKEVYWLVGIYETPIFGGIENIIVPKYICSDFYHVTLTSMLLAIIFMWGFSWWLPITLGIVVGLVCYSNIRSLIYTIKQIISMHQSRVEFSRMTWKEQLAARKELEEHTQDLDDIIKAMRENEKDE